MRQESPVIEIEGIQYQLDIERNILIDMNNPDQHINLDFMEGQAAQKIRAFLEDVCKEQSKIAGTGRIERHGLKYRRW